MKTVYKYCEPSEPKSDLFSFNLPTGAQIFDARYNEDGTLTLWAYVDTQVPPAYRTIVVAGTGHPLNKYITESLSLQHIATQHSGPFVWHIFELAYLRAGVIVMYPHAYRPWILLVQWHTGQSSRQDFGRMMKLYVQSYLKLQQRQHARSAKITKNFQPGGIVPPLIYGGAQGQGKNRIHPHL